MQDWLARGAAAVDELDRFSRLVLLLQEAALGSRVWDAVVSEIVAAAGGSDRVGNADGPAFGSRRRDAAGRRDDGSR